MKTVVAPTDFSMASSSSVMYAANLAVYLNARLVLLHVIVIPPATLELPVSGMELEAVEGRATSGLEEEEARLNAGIGKQIMISKEIRYGIVEEQIEKLCDEQDVFAVVIGCYHQDPVSRIVWGSHTLKMIEYSKYPILLIPQGLTFYPLKRMTLAWDLRKEISDSSIQQIKAWVNVFHSFLEILNIYSEELFPPKKLPVLESLKQKMLSINAAFTFIQSLHVDETLQAFMSDKKPDLLILLPEKRGYMESLFHRSHSKRIIQITNLVILSIPLQLATGMIPAGKQIDSNRCRSLS